MITNQNGDAVEETTISQYDGFLGENEVTEALLLLAEKMGFEFVRTNATKHGNIEIVLREK